MWSPTSQDSNPLLYKAAEEEFEINTLKVYETITRAERAYSSSSIQCQCISKSNLHIAYGSSSTCLKKILLTPLFIFVFFSSTHFKGSFQCISSAPISLYILRVLLVYFNLDVGRVWITTSFKTAFVCSLIKQTFPRRKSTRWPRTTCEEVPPVFPEVTDAWSLDARWCFWRCSRMLRFVSALLTWQIQ